MATYMHICTYHMNKSIHTGTVMMEKYVNSFNIKMYHNLISLYILVNQNTRFLRGLLYLLTITHRGGSRGGPRGPVPPPSKIFVVMLTVA